MDIYRLGTMQGGDFPLFLNLVKKKGKNKTIPKLWKNNLQVFLDSSCFVWYPFVQYFGESAAWIPVYVSGHGISALLIENGCGFVLSSNLLLFLSLPVK